MCFVNVWGSHAVVNVSRQVDKYSCERTKIVKYPENYQ
jgi:hypothetical protein